MLNIVEFLVNLVLERTIWLYAAAALVILYYIYVYTSAHRERMNTIFTIEKEIAAHKEGRAMSGIGVMLGLVVVITVAKHYVVPSLGLEALIEPTPTITLGIPTPDLTREAEEVATPTPEQAGLPTATPRPQPTIAPTATPAPPTPTPPPPPAPCPNANVRITSPGMNAEVSGVIAIRGTANHEQFQFYKVEYGVGERPTAWHVINDVQRAPVESGVLVEFNTAALPNGVYWIQLTVVDQTGNFPPPCQVRIVIAN